MDTAGFRLDFPAFLDAAMYPDTQVRFYLSLACRFINAQRWPADLIDYSTGLFVAHHLVIAGQAGANGSAQPGAVGVASSKSVDRVAVSYDTQIATDPKAGHWNLSVYGLQYRELVKMIGAGPVQLPSGAGASGSTPRGQPAGSDNGDPAPIPRIIDGGTF